MRLAAVLMLQGVLASAAVAQSEPGRNDRVRSCIMEAAQKQHLNPQLLWAIAYVESRFKQGVVSDLRSDSSIDVGIMQINSIHFPELAKRGISKEMLLDDCVSIHVGAWIMAKNVKRHGYTWQAVQAYNPRDKNYPNKVWTVYQQISKR